MGSSRRKVRASSCWERNEDVVPISERKERTATRPEKRLSGILSLRRS